MQRREFLRHSAAWSAAGIAAAAGAVPSAGAADESQPDARALARKPPRWRGFNLLEKFNVARNEPFLESDFAWMAEWGFDFARLPMDYRCWTDADDPYRLDEKVLGEIDQAVRWGRQYGVHVSLNLHRAPGYTVARPPEKLNLWADEEAQKQFAFQWTRFAERYRGIASAQLSFNLVNEPANVPAETYLAVAKRTIEAIRRVDPDRLVVSDGLQWGRVPILQLAELGVIQSTRGYDPMPVSHYQASWVNGSRWKEPTWPLEQDGRLIDRRWLYENHIASWKKLEEHGGGVHVGECGAYNKTPHQVVLAWLGDWLALWKEAGWGWALWNLRGSFGVVDSGRSDVVYEHFHGHQLDRKLLELLRQG